MRYQIAILPLWQSTFSLFGFHYSDSYVELDGESLHIHFGTADERIPLGEIAKAELREWPFYYGLGPKIGPNGGVSYIGSANDVVQIDFRKPRRMNVWGPFHVSSANCIIISLENAVQFIENVTKYTMSLTSS